MLERAPSPALPDRRQVTRALGYMYLAGASLSVLVLVLIPPARGKAAILVAPLALAFVVGIGLVRGAHRSGRWTIPLSVAFGVILISVGQYFTWGMRANNAMFYLWVTLCAFYLLPIRVAFAELGLIGASYAIVLSLHHDPVVVPRWLITMGTLSIAGIFTARLVEKLEGWVHRSTERESQLRQAEARFRSAFEDAAIGMALVGLDGTWLRANQALAHLTGYPAEKLIGMSFRDLTPPEDVGKDEHALHALVSGELTTHQTEKRYVRADGEIVWVLLSVSAVRGADGKPQHLISQMQDITDRRDAQRELAERALHDPLTGLPNRLLFADRVEVALSRTERGQGAVAVFFLDLDNFKLVNDTLGHAAGDLLLIEVAGRLRRAVRPEDTVARLGGDEFTLLCEQTDAKEAEAIAGRIVQVLARPFEIDGHTLSASASIGIAIAHDHESDASQLLSHADTAMYAAKDRGRSNFAMFDAAMGRAQRRLQLVQIDDLEARQAKPAEPARDSA